ncbi:mavicyanin-like [Juglans microcarpa x Juglans regia]|uniref:mavicyanin-like n=1 Tax=Juglans microcarpa x Juglans regia TaxID=2249226 RepID=UPI001B7E21BB|nr:mavicyanin-like [Juglans microcarpa x Juglans regia]
MALAGKCFVLLMVMAAVHISNAAVYKVGDSAGWTTIGNIDYKQWAATKTFRVGDIIHFEYNAQFHNVMRVTHAMYRACNVSAPLATYTTGNDTIKITRRGHHFFFCGVPGHCQAGQKVDINVPRNLSTTAPTPSALVSPLVPPARIPVPSPSKAVPFSALKDGFGSFGLMAMAVVALLVFGSA